MIKEKKRRWGKSVIEEIETAIKQLYQALKNSHSAWISYSSLDYARDQLRANLQKLIRALQAAHHRRLSIDLLPSDTLKKLFDAAARKARSHHHQLLQGMEKHGDES